MMFTAPQIHAIELISRGGHTLVEVAEIVGVSETTIHNWKHDKEFCEAILAAAKEHYRTTLPDVQKTLISKALKGDAACLRIYFDHMEMIEKFKSLSEDTNITFCWNIPQEPQCSGSLTTPPTTTN